MQIGNVEMKTPATGMNEQTKTTPERNAIWGMPRNSMPVAVSAVLMMAISSCASRKRPSTWAKRNTVVETSS